MDKKTYLKKFSRSVCWRLPEKESAEVLADYEELLSQRPDASGDSLIQDLGDPSKAAALLTSPRDYRRWLIVFGTMSICLLVPLWKLLKTQFWRKETIVMWCLFLLGITVSFLWFRLRSKAVKAPLPGKLLPCMGILLLFLVCSGAVLGGLAAGVWESLPPRMYGMIGHGVLRLTGFVAAAAALYGLVNARIADRRWRALYVLGLTVLIECVLVLSLLAGMDMSNSVPNWWVEYVVRWCVLGGAGLVAAGASLC